MFKQLNTEANGLSENKPALLSCSVVMGASQEEKDTEAIYRAIVNTGGFLI